MPEKIEELEKRIAEGLEAVRELKRLTTEEQRKEQKKRFRLIKGGAVGAAVWAGVEWLWGYKAALVVAAAAVTFTGGLIADDPGSPGADPPPTPVITHPPPQVHPTKKPVVKPSTPRGTSPPRARIAPPSDPPASKPPPTTQTKEPASVTTQAKKPTEDPIVSLPVTPTVTPSAAVETVTALPCTINLLGVKLCLPHG